MKKSDNSQMLTGKKSKAKKRATICLESCNFPIVHDVAKSIGLETVKSVSPTCDLYWSDTPMDVKELKNFKNYQKTNHFPGMSEICRKDLLARNLNRMAEYFVNDYNFFPLTWQLPSDHAKLQTYMNNHKASTYIVKPSSGGRGIGIYLIKYLKKIEKYEQMICQLYIPNLMLIDGYKFDIRVYTLIASCDPLKVYIYNDGLVRLATVPYTKPTERNMNNTFMHLTNYSVNKHSKQYIDHEIVGSKRRIATLNDLLRKNGHDVKKMWDKIDDAIIKTIILAYPYVSRSYKTCFTGHLYTQACFEILGFDIILDEHCKPYLLEVNSSPDLHTSTSIDKTVKRQLLTDTFKLLQLGKTYKNAVSAEQKWKTTQRALNTDKDVFKQRKIDCKVKYEQQNNQWENENMGNYRLVFSEKNRSSYEHFFYRNENKLYQNTNRPSLFLMPMMSTKEQLENKQIKGKNAIVKYVISNGQKKQVIGQTNNIKNQDFIKKNIFTLVAPKEMKGKESIIPVVPHLNVDSSLKNNIRIKTPFIKSRNHIIIKRILNGNCNKLKIQSAKTSLRQIVGDVKGVNSHEMIKKKNKEKFPDVQSCLFIKHSKKKKCFSTDWESEMIDQTEENYWLDNMFDRAQNIFKLDVKESIYKAFEKLNNLNEIDRDDYMEYKQKRVFLGYKPHMYRIVNINADGRVYVEDKICQEI